MTKEEAAAAEKQEDAKAEEKKEETKDEGETSEKKEGEGEEGSAEGEEGAAEGEEGAVGGKGGKKQRKWPWSKRGGAPPSAAAGAAAAENGEGGEPEAEPEKPPQTDAEIETELNKRQKELTSEKNQLTQRLELYKKVQKLEQEVADMKGELDTLKEARGLPTSSEANKPYALRP